MKICAVIAEYNPFHDGHLNQIRYIKDQLPDAAIVAIMSGNIVQRGELAVLDKYVRAESAVKCGVDAVLELPYPWCGGSAGYFARGAVEIAKAVGAHYLCFGSESGDIDELKRAAHRTVSAEYTLLLESLIKDEPETAYIALSRKAYRQLYGDNIPDGANNTLAIEYLKYTGNSIVPLTYKRTYPSSATAARGFYRTGDMAALNATVPEILHDLYANNDVVCAERVAPLILWQLCNSNLQELSEYADADMGIAGRIQAAAKESGSLEELYKRCATKKYTDSRVRRVVLNMILGTKKHLLDDVPRFTVLLSANEKGRKAVRQIKKTGNIEIITKPADHDTAQEQFMFSNKADTLFAAAQGKSHASTLKKKPVIL